MFQKRCISIYGEHDSVYIRRDNICFIRSDVIIYPNFIALTCWTVDNIFPSLWYY